MCDPYLSAFGVSHDKGAIQVHVTSPSPGYGYCLGPMTADLGTVVYSAGRVARRYVRSPTKGARQTAASPTRPAAAVVSTPPIYRRPTPAS